VGPANTSPNFCIALYVANEWGTFWCVKVKLYLTLTDDLSPSQNNSSAEYPITLGGSANMLTPGSNVGVSAAASQLSDFDDDTSDPEEDLSETDDDDELWSSVSAVLEHTRV